MTTAQAEALELIGKNAFAGKPLTVAQERALSIIERRIAKSTGSVKEHYHKVRDAIMSVRIEFPE